VLIGVISDTHGHIDPRALAALRGAELILHAGDIGGEQVITTLEALAPVLAVRGNTDTGPLARRYPAMHRLERAGVRITITHIGGRPEELARALPREEELRPQVYIFGHSHVALLETVDGVLFLNPGAAGRPRFGGGLSVALLEVGAGRAAAQIVRLE
jgi:putative phosphoesterase